MSGTDGLMDGGLVNVSEAERSLVNSPLTQSTGLIPYVCVCLVIWAQSSPDASQI